MHDHHHGHHHHHHHHFSGDPSELKNIALGFILNFTFAIIELIGGWLTGSVAILSSAIHDLGDSISLGLAYVMVKKSNEKKDGEFSYGFRRYSLLSAVITGTVLLVGSLFVFWEAIPRLFNPIAPDADGMLLFAFLGLGVNGFMAYRMSHGESINEQVISYHFLEDVLGWAMVLIIALVLRFVDWPILDPILSIIYTLFILKGVVGILLKAAKIFLQACPGGQRIDQLEQKIMTVKGVKAVHDTHFWSLDGQKHVLTTHVKVEDTASVVACEDIKDRIRDKLSYLGKFQSTIELVAESKVIEEDDDDEHDHGHCHGHDHSHKHDDKHDHKHDDKVTEKHDHDHKHDDDHDHGHESKECTTSPS